MKKFKAWFAGTATGYLVHAESRRDAVEKFALYQGVRPSGYIQARRASETETYLLTDISKVERGPQ